MKTIFCLFCIVSITISGFSQKRYDFNETVYKAVVLLEKHVGNKFEPHGTGILFTDNQDSSKRIIVTCQHVLARQDIYVTIETTPEFRALNSTQNGRRLYLNGYEWTYNDGVIRTKVTLKKDSSYVRHPHGLDVAVFKVSVPLQITKNSTKTPIVNARDISNTFIRLKNNVSVGEDVFFLGFPYGLGTGFPLTPILRKGAVAWISDKYFLLDAMSYNGNSGSPVFTHPDSEVILDGLKFVNHPVRFII